MIELLLRVGADKNRAIVDGGTPLFVAARRGNAQMVELLLSAGADKDKGIIQGASPLL